MLDCQGAPQELAVPSVLCHSVRSHPHIPDLTLLLTLQRLMLAFEVNIVS